MIKRLSKVAVFALFLIFFIPNVVLAQEETTQPEERFEAKVTEIAEQRYQEFDDNRQLYQKLNLVVTTGQRKGQQITVENGTVSMLTVPEYKVGDGVVISVARGLENEEHYFIVDYVRRPALYLLFGILILMTIAIGRLRGFNSLIGLAVSFIVITTFILPQILAGKNPILIAIAGSFVIVPVTFYISHGVNKKTTAAVLGTLVALLFTGFLAHIFIELTRLTGFANEDAAFLESAKRGQINIKGLLLAGIIIGVSGILDDITISQTSIVQELKHTAPHLHIRQLYTRAMRVGRDHIASVINTLVLVYTGAAMPLLLLFLNSPYPFGTIINMEVVTEEIVRTLVATIGLIMAVPIATVLACLFLNTTTPAKLPK